MKKVILVSDLFSNEVIGGAEICNEAIVNYFLQNNIFVEKIRTSDIDKNYLSLNKDNSFLIANFMNLSEENKQFFINNLYKKYIIIEHDHKYARNNNPSIYTNFLIPENEIINKKFFQSAKAVLAQSSLHADVITRNLNLNNLVNLSGNVWTKDQISILSKNLNNEKTIDYAIFETRNKNKGMIAAIDYCVKNKLNYTLIPLLEYKKFIEVLSTVKTLVFFPQWLETFSRVSVEAKILGCKILSNSLIGASSESFFKQQPQEIINYIEDCSIRIPQTILDIFNDKKIIFYEKPKLPTISIITSLYKAEKYIENFLENITKQTIFDDCELILIDAYYTDKQYSIIKQYQEKYSNIKYYKLDKDPGIYGCWNLGIKYSTGEYICNSNVDDCREIENLEILRKHLYYNKDIDLVYGDSCEVNEIPTLNKKYNLSLYEHSINHFSKENMIKCLPGPLPLWKRSMHEKVGLFDEEYKFAGDWELWLRAAKKDCKFKKVNTISGYYYHNPEGKSTNIALSKQKFLEEKKIFFEYKDVFGSNFYKYNQWFEREMQ